MNVLKFGTGEGRSFHMCDFPSGESVGELCELVTECTVLQYCFSILKDKLVSQQV
jgi:hypothetical protein